MGRNKHIHLQGGVHEEIKLPYFNKTGDLRANVLISGAAGVVMSGTGIDADQFDGRMQVDLHVAHVVGDKSIRVIGVQEASGSATGSDWGFVAGLSSAFTESGSLNLDFNVDEKLTKRFIRIGGTVSGSWYVVATYKGKARQI